MLRKSSSSEKIAAKTRVMQNIPLLKNWLFFQNAALLKKLMLCSSVDMFILNNSFAKIVAVPKSNCPKKLHIIKKW